MDINVNLKVTFDETPALLNCLTALTDSLQRICAITAEPVPRLVQTPKPTAPVINQPAPAAPAHVYALPELQAACAPLMDQGKLNELQQVVASFGVTNLLDIPEARYGELATKLRELGARL